jgi:hypothetical protein
VAHGVEGHYAAHQDHAGDKDIIGGTDRAARYGTIPLIRWRARLLRGSATETEMANAQDEHLQDRGHGKQTKLA